jgi:uncharacterized protein (UPF0548 family)
MRVTWRGGLGSALALLEESLLREPTYDPSSPPPGLHAIDREVELGSGQAVFGRCSGALATYDMHRRAGLRAWASAPRAEVGATVVLALPLGPVWALAPCRVVTRVDEDARQGFAYATLPGHPERGVEEFVVERRGDSVWFVIHALSEPASWATRLVGPVGHALQRRATDRYVAAMRAVALD